MEKYNHKEIEKKWQKIWADQKIFEVEVDEKKPKFYGLIEFPYPSGDGLHTGHPRSNTAMDIICRKRKMEGFNVLYPIGFDSFGLPTENYAIKMGVNPKIITEKNIQIFTRQLKSLGFGFDWSRVFSTTDEDYYKWTQWIFLQMFKNGLAYKAKEAINWCTSCKVGLANEEVVNGKCERCGGEVVQKEKEQWILRITKYADRLIDDLGTVDYLEKIKTQQINWIGRSEGAEVDFSITTTPPSTAVGAPLLRKEGISSPSEGEVVRSERTGGVADTLKVFTTRPDTLFGATFMVVAPEHEIISNFESRISNFGEVKKYIEESKKKTDIERTDLAKEKTGVELKGIKAINPVNNKEIPIFVADYVLMGYGTGAIMAVPAHDTRDYEFAKKYGLEIVEVVKDIKALKHENIKTKEECFIGDGVAINSGEFDGLTTVEFKEKITAWLEEKGIGKKTVNYKLHDWIFSRQRYWGEPIPMVYCETCAKKKTTVLIIHGFGGHSQENWFPWFKKEMEARGINIFIPDMPNTDSPKLEEWLESLEKLKDKFAGDLMVIGHSLGAPAACKFIEKNNLAVKKLILVGPAGKNCLNLEGLRKAGFDESDLEVAKDFCGEEPDWKILNKLAEKKVVYLSENDPFIIASDAKKEYKALNPEFIVFENKGHFNEGYGIKEFPEILKEFAELENNGWVPVPENELPVVLPEIEDFMPTDSGDSPLAKATDWINTKCPVCGGPAKRETDVMPNWAGSNWYFIRYCDPKNNKMMVDPKKAKYWLPVDWYNGGMEHTTLHLLYSRFVWKFLYDINAVPRECGNEPYKKRTAHGMVLGEGGIKMSKSKGNVINPDDYVQKFGADTVRLYEMFMGPFDQQIPWDDKGVVGVYRFLNKVWDLQEKVNRNQKSEIGDKKLLTLLHQTIKKVGEDIENMRFNTAISAMMILVNEMEKQPELRVTDYELLITILSPFAPHLSEEIWSQLGHKKSILFESWPEYDPKLIVADEIEIGVQINGKLRDAIAISIKASEDEIKSVVLASPKVKKWLDGKEPKKIIYIKGKIVSIVV
ncbi:MAG: leucine--tRNA ligase [Patescibacteria group bacterium]|nr:leucine--tRNA ligase [Patescibacteria group bacterium]